MIAMNDVDMECYISVTLHMKSDLQWFLLFAQTQSTDSSHSRLRRFTRL